jgi:hypothetical protein
MGRGASGSVCAHHCPSYQTLGAQARLRTRRAHVETVLLEPRRGPVAADSRQLTPTAAPRKRAPAASPFAAQLASAARFSK